MTVAGVRRLADVRMADVAEVGGKAASLGELLASGVRVPDGVVIAADAADMTSDERRWLSGAGAWDLGAGPFAVRSSGIAEDGVERSFAGMYESVLNVSADDVPAAVDRCLASASAARVAEYEAAGGGRMAVIVQRMVAAAAAGVALTADPINGDRSTCVVTAVRGLGERLVSGEAQGDEWVVGERGATARRQPEHAIDRHQAVAIATEARRIAAARGTPQDIEWAIDGDGTLWIVQARPMTALPPEVSWASPAPGAYTRMLRFGEWIGEPVTPLFESWLLTGMEDRMHAFFREEIGQIAPRPYHVVVNGWYFYSINFISGRALLRSFPTMLVKAIRSPRNIAGIIPPTVRFSFPIFERRWREDLQPRYRASVADAERSVETLPVADLPALIDELAALAGEYFGGIAALSGAAYKMEMNLAQFYRRHLAAAPGDSHLPLLSGFEPPAERQQRPAMVSLDWWHAPLPVEATATNQAERHGRVVEARQAAEAEAFAALASSPRRLRTFRRVLADAQHLVPIREEQTEELTIAWPVLRRAVLRIGEALADGGAIAEPDDVFFLTRDEALAALGGAPPAPAVDVSGAAVPACGAGAPRAPAPGRPREPDDPAGLGQLPGAHRCTSVGRRARFRRSGICRSIHRDRSRDPGSGRVRPAAAGRDPRGTLHGTRLDAALHPRGRGRHRRWERGVARLDHRARVRHPGRRRMQRCDGTPANGDARHGRRQHRKRRA